MSSESYRRQIQGHLKEIAKLQREKGKHAEHAADHQKRSNDYAVKASKASSSSSSQSCWRDSQRHAEQAVQAQKKVADTEDKIAREHSRLADAQKNLAREEAREVQLRQREEAKILRSNEKRLRAMNETLAQHDQMHSSTQEAIDRLSKLPDRITVLFMASNPLDQPQLRLDEEARAITEMIRKSQHRDSVKLESWWATRPLDVLQAINEHRPNVVHFSGHGSNQDEIVFQDSSGSHKLVTKEAIVQTMAAASGDIRLVFFNTCHSRNQAAAVVKHVQATIGMSKSIGDSAARVFAAQFYSAIGFGLSISRAFEQAKAALMLEGIPEQDTPELFVASGLDADQLVLVKPE